MCEVLATLSTLFEARFALSGSLRGAAEGTSLVTSYIVTADIGLCYLNYLVKVII